MSNPTELVAQFDTDFGAETQAGDVTFMDAGSPAVDYQPWGFGGWGQMGPWGQFLPKMLQLRSATSDIVSISPTSYLSPSTGSICFRFVRYDDTGGSEIILQVGVDPDDKLLILIDSDDKLYMYWYSNGGLPQIIGSTETIALDTLYLFYFEWDGITQALSVNNGTKVVGLRDVVTGVWGSVDLQLKAA